MSVKSLWSLSAPILMAAVFTAGCATSSLEKSRAGQTFPEPTLPIVIGITSIKDPVATDDPALYLRDYLLRHRAMLGVELLPPWTDTGQVDADYVISGEINVPKPYEKKKSCF